MKHSISFQITIIFLITLFLLSGYTSFGSRNIARDRFNYNEAIAQSHNQQMLLNIVRLRYLEIPNFLGVSSVITSYSYDGSFGLSGTSNANPSNEIITENPTLH